MVRSVKGSSRGALLSKQSGGGGRIGRGRQQAGDAEEQLGRTVTGAVPTLPREAVPEPPASRSAGNPPICGAISPASRISSSRSSAP